MNQQQIEAWIAQNGGSGGVQYNSSTRRVRNPARMMTNQDGSENPNYDPTAPEWIDVNEESWTNSKTGATLRVSRRPDGESFDVLENKSSDPNKGPEVRNPSQVASDEKAKREQAEREKNAALPADQDPAYETDKERRDRAEARIQQQGRDAEATRQRARQEAQDTRQTRIDEQNAANQAATLRRAEAQERRLAEESKRPDTKVESRDLGGQRYLISVTTPKDGSAPTIRYFGPDGAQIPRLPSEGEATAGGPPMPQIIHSMAAQSARDYHAALWADPSLTPAQREKRFQEFIQAANLAVQQAGIDQRERESQRNTQYDVSSKTIDYLNSSTQDALKFASGLKGTDLGGKVFAAMMGYNLAVLEASGLGALANGQPVPPVPQITAADMRSGPAIDAKRAQIMANPVFRPQPMATAPGGQAASAMAEAARQAAMAGATAGPPTTPARPPGPAAPSPPTAPGTPSLVGDTGAPPITTPQSGPPPSMVPGTVSPVNDTGAPPPAGAGFVFDPRSPNPPPTPMSSVEPYQPPAGPDLLPQYAPFPDAGFSPNAEQSTPNYEVSPPQPYNADPSQGPVGLARPEQFSALEQFGPQASAAPSPPDPRAFEASPALLRAQLASKPPWMMDESTYRQAVSAGLEDEFWRVPGAA